MPVYGVENFYKIRNAKDEAIMKTVKWRGGTSWTVAAWGLWMPTLVIYLVYSPPSIRLEDILNPVLLYYTHLAIVFVAWSASSRTRESFKAQYFFFLHCYADNYTPIQTLSEQLSIPMYVDTLLKKLHLRSAVDFNPINADKRFYKYITKERRASYISRKWTGLRIEFQKKVDPYARKMYPSSKAAMFIATITPFVVRAIGGRSLLGDDIPSIVANVLLATLLCWEWWSLMEVFVRPAVREVHVVGTMVERILAFSIGHHINLLNARNHIYDRSHPESFLDKELILNLSSQQNVVGFFIMYLLIGKYAKLKTTGLEYMLMALLSIQTLVTFTFLALSFSAPESITLNVGAYVVVESAFCLYIILKSLRACVSVNDAYKLVRLKCLEVIALLDFVEIGANTSKTTNAFRGILAYLDRARVVEARVFGVYLSCDLVAKIMITLP